MATKGITRRELLDRWRGIEEEDDDDDNANVASASHSRPRPSLHHLKEEWFVSVLYMRLCACVPDPICYCLLLPECCVFVLVKFVNCPSFFTLNFNLRVLSVSFFPHGALNMQCRLGYTGSELFCSGTPHKYARRSHLRASIWATWRKPRKESVAQQSMSQA